MPSQELKDAEYYMKILRQHMPELRDKYSVNYLGVFGSYIRGGSRQKIVTLMFWFSLIRNQDC